MTNTSAIRVLGGTICSLESALTLAREAQERALQAHRNGELVERHPTTTELADELDDAMRDANRAASQLESVADHFYKLSEA